jgi:hypothetical protein
MSDIPGNSMAIRFLSTNFTENSIFDTAIFVVQTAEKRLISPSCRRAFILQFMPSCARKLSWSTTKPLLPTGSVPLSDIVRSVFLKSIQQRRVSDAQAPDISKACAASASKSNNTANRPAAMNAHPMRWRAVDGRGGGKCIRTLLAEYQLV